jgi:hypothetical protein
MKKSIFIIALIGCFALVTNSCVKKEDTIAKIEVRDENNNLVEQAMVVLHGTSTSIVLLKWWYTIPLTPMPQVLQPSITMKFTS